MLQLFQPTNITPDTRGSFGNGVVEVDIPGITSDYISVSWQVNGNTPMTAFKIDFTDMDGTALYTTGKLTNNCPFYGTAADGTVNRFKYTIGPMSTATSFLRSASEGLLKITEWWGSGANDYVEQYSPSPYLVRPALTVSYSPTTISSRTGTFTGSFTGASDDGLMWIRWVLTRADTGQIVKDTGRLYGCVNPTFTYDKFLPGSYYLELTAETSAGVQSREAAWTSVTVSYTLQDTGLEVEATRPCDGESAVLVRWSMPYNIPRISVTGSVYDSGGAGIFLFSGSSMLWNQVNGSSMDLKTPWSFIWSGFITETGDGDLFSLGLENNRRVEFGLHYDPNETQKYLYYRLMKGNNQTYIMRLWGNYTDGACFVCITPNNIFIQYNRIAFVNGLYPEDDLYPDNSLYPNDGDFKVEFHKFPSWLDFDDPDYLQTDLKSVTLYGYSILKYAKVVDHIVQPNVGPGYDVVTNYNGDDPDMNFDPGTLFLLKSEAGQDWNAGNSAYDSSMTGMAVYRKTEGQTALEYVGTVSGTGTVKILDYAARSQQGPYTYYLYPLTSTAVESNPAISNSIDPCFWNWTVLACQKQSSGDYKVQQSFSFGLNVSSGAISNRNAPNILNNFSRYPTVQIAPQNYKSGTLQSLIGYIDHTDCQEKYSDSIDLSEAIYNLSTYTGFLFLKDRKGGLYMIRPAGEVTMETMDNTREQAQTVNFPWVEVGDASEVAIIG